MAPSDQDCTELPPFPEDVPIAPLVCLSLKKLLVHDHSETQRLMQACETLEFFYLDLQDAGPSSTILNDVDQLFQITVELFKLPLEEKRKYDFSGQRSYFGYKPQGTRIVDPQGNVDRNENYNVPRNDMLDIVTPDSVPTPEVLKRNRATFQSMMRKSHAISTLLLKLINSSLGLPESTLMSLHRIDAPSGDLVRLIKAPPQPAHDRGITLPAHTDYGSITIVGGLQVFSPPGPDAQWLYVKPLPGHAVINIGDAMVNFTNGLLRSNLHRIVSPLGEQAKFTRYSLLYFCRPDDDVLLRRLEGSTRIPVPEKGLEEEKINAKDWILRRGMTGRADGLYEG